MKKMELKAATGPLRDYASGRDFEPLLLTAKGKPVAALIHLAKGADFEAVALGMNPEFISIIQSSRQRANREGKSSIDKVRRRLGVMRRPAAKGR